MTGEEGEVEVVEEINSRLNRPATDSVHAAEAAGARDE